MTIDEWSGNRNGVGGWVGGIPLIELTNSKISISFFLEDIDPMFKILKNVLGRSQGLFDTCLFPNVRFLRL